MERNQVLSDYWNLRKLLNQGNKLANEKTALDFTIESLPLSEYRLVASIKGEQEVHKIELVRRDRNGNWERSGYTQFKILENYCAIKLNERQRLGLKQKDSVRAISKEQLELLGRYLQSIFDNQLVD